MATGDRVDPYGAFRFHLEIDSVIVAGFLEVSGLNVETEVEERSEGGLNDQVHTLVKGSKSPRLILKRGLTHSEALWNWHQEVVAGRIKRRSGRVLLFDTTGAEKWRWTFEGAYPVKWTGPDLKADSGAVAFEAVELVHRGIHKG
jgi:phage tail-like protein